MIDGGRGFSRPPGETGHTGSDVESCLVLVTSYIGAVSLVESVTDEATGRLMMSPSLGDFIELRYAHIGDQPSLGGQQSAAARITDHLLRARPGIGRSYFAVVVMDRSAAAVEAALEDCAASPLLGSLPIRLLGIASREDRRGARPARAAEILVSPTGAWQRPELVAELLRYADALMRDFADGRQSGLTPGQLARHRAQFDASVLRPDADTPPPGLTEGEPGRGATPVEDALEPSAEPGQPGSPATPATSGPDGQAADDEPDPDHPKAEAGRPRPNLARRLMPELRWRRGARPDAEAPPPASAAGGLAYLLLTGDQHAGDPAEWNRGRAVALQIDQRLGALPRLCVSVRVLEGDDMELRGDLRAAGQLTKRDVRGAVSDLYLGTVLDQVRVMLSRDRARLASGPPLTRPAVVLIAPVPPMADSAGVSALRRLAEEASVAWVVPRNQAHLIAEEFIEAGRLITDWPAAADELAALFPAFPGPDDAEGGDPTRGGEAPQAS